MHGVRALLAAACAAALCQFGGASPACAQSASVAVDESVQPVPGAADPRRMEDLMVLRRDFLARDQSYSDAARAEAEARLARLINAADGLSQAAFELEIARIAALADNGHTAAFPAYRAARYNRAPIRLEAMEGGFYVLRARTPNDDLLGARLEGVDGRPFRETLNAARALAGGETAWRDAMAPFFFESPEQMFAAGVADAAESALYRFRLPDGRIVERRLDGERGTPLWRRLDARRWLWPERAPSEGADWIAALAPERAPPAFTEPDVPFRFRDAPEHDAFIIELRQNRDALGQRIEDFLAAAERERRMAHRRNLILDMRFNSGGDLTTTQPYMREFAREVRGRIVVLTSRWTFSAAIASIGYLKQVGREHVVIVGEPVGDRLQFWAEGDFVTLPNSGVRLLFADGFHDYRDGCRRAICHPAVELRPIAVPNLAPDIAAPLTIEAYLAGRDPAMEAAFAALQR
ncbi:MAG: hypothetical protein GC189_10205 [Alphaproteobacteria bacterium]|nr:hypothetical protein [Alphaproteobacteria bacterium]